MATNSGLVTATRKLSIRFAAALLVVSPIAAAGAPEAPPAGGQERSQAAAALDAAAKDLCGRQVVLLGENGYHGDGKTIAFKADLVRRLVDRCGFRAVFFEASHYDFLAFGRALRSPEGATAAMLSSAVGPLWNQNAEFAPLVSHLHAAARSGRVILGGLDDQLGTRGAFHSLERMPAELAAYLDGNRRGECGEKLKRRIWSDFPAERPYSRADQAAIAGCLRDIRAAIPSSGPDPRTGEEDLAMVASFQRAIARDFEAPESRNPARDRSMYVNFRWLLDRLPGSAKVVIWSANEHVAKYPAAVPGFHAGPNLGFLVRRAYGPRAFALGFSAASGSFRWSSRESRPVPAAPRDSLEGTALAGSGAAVGYLGPDRLRRLGEVRGAMFGHQPAVAPWVRMFDGVIVFRAERPPVRLDEAPAPAN